MTRASIFTFLVAYASASLAQGSLEVVPLRHRSAEQVLPVLRPLVAPGGAVTSQSRPLTQRHVFSGPGGTLVRETTAIQDIDTGFEVTPRLSGNTVFLDIHPQRETPGALGTVQSQRVSSSISAPLGEWVELGAAAESASSSAGGVLSSRDASRTQTRSVWVRVEELRP